MVGAPHQTLDNILEDIRFLQELNPHMIGIGPFLSHKDTPFCDCKNGTAEMTLKLLSVFRLIFPTVLLPATTALGSLTPDGREQGIKAGANVVMPNLSPFAVRKLYSLYDNKLSTGSESAQALSELKEKIKSIGYEVTVSRGDFIKE